jgi:hypothetical protein
MLQTKIKEKYLPKVRQRAYLNNLGLGGFWDLNRLADLPLVLTYDDPQAEDEESSLPHLEGFQSKLPPGILPHGLPKVKEMEPALTNVETEQKKEAKQSK